MHKELLLSLSKLDENELSLYHQNGFLLLENRIFPHEINFIKQAIAQMLELNLPGKTHEKTGTAVRSIHGPQLYYQGLSRVLQLSRLLSPAMQILGQQLYVHQCKINTKAAFEGDIWEWHQDYIFWKKEDNMPKPLAMNAVIYLDDVTEFNAPIFLIPGSHKTGMVDMLTHDNLDLPANAPSWLANTTAKLNYGAENTLIHDLIKKQGLFSAKSAAGSILFFDCNLFHASSANISPFDRQMMIISYNRTDNRPQLNKKNRPEFLSSQSFAPLQPLFEEIKQAL
jgi:ectoine hydroxylase-related dioxygenase (phytanoyl-CoA dioxygenase family)